ncbi:glycosyltransferase [Candidatus Zixiibacteriota bacterium]
MNILFVSRTVSSKINAYNHRLKMLRQGLRRLGAQADILFMGDRIRPEPVLLSPLQFSKVASRLDGYDFIHAGTALAAYPFCCHRGHFQAALIHDMHGHSSEMLMMLKMYGQRWKSTLRLAQSLWVEEMAIHRSDYHLVVSRPLLGRLLAHRVDRGRTLLLRNGVDIQLFRPPGCSPEKEFTVCYAGDYQAWQGVELLVDAGEILGSADIRWKFIGFRQTKEHQGWKDRIHRALGSKAELVDRVGQQELIPLLGAADLLVLPRPYHPATAVAMPTKFAEYIALGKPVLVTDVDETARFVRQHDCGLVCQPSASGLAAAIVQAREMGPEKLSAMGQRGRRLAESTFSWDVICQKYHDFLSTIDLRQFIESNRCSTPC